MTIMPVERITKEVMIQLLEGFPAYVAEQIKQPERAQAYAGTPGDEYECPVHHYLKAVTGQEFSVGAEIVWYDNGDRRASADNFPVPSKIGTMIREIDDNADYEYTNDEDEPGEIIDMTWQEVATILNIPVPS